MHQYLNFYSAIQELHERGYTQDFVLFETDLYWTQEKSFIPPSEFAIQECYQFSFPVADHKREDLIIFAITAISEDVKGILLNHYSYTSEMPTVIREKLSEMGYYSSRLTADLS